ncbi:MAG: hypothetical protein HFI32_00390 [Lachnospiraceae bacterium]|nr:hypothetical protein [Lachnospiraceae bacterium]
MKEKIGRALLSFFILMICCTLVARGADSVTLAQVQTSAWKSGTLSHSFSGTGTLLARSRTYQFLPVGQKVSLVLAKPGTQVEEGTPLIQLDPDYLNDQIRDQKRNIQKLKLTMEQQKLNGQTPARLPATAQAELSLDSARNARNKAREDLRQAQEAYQRFLEEQKANPGTDDKKPEGPGSETQTPGTPNSNPGTQTPGASGSDPGTQTPGASGSNPGTQTPATPDSNPGTQTPDASGSNPGTQAPTTPGSNPGTQTPATPDPNPGTQTPATPGSDSPDTETSGDAPETQTPDVSDSDLGTQTPDEKDSGADLQNAEPEASFSRSSTRMDAKTAIPYTAVQEMPALGAQAPKQDTAPDQPAPDQEQQKEALEQQKLALEQEIHAAQAQLDSAQSLYDQAKDSYRLAEQEEANAQSNESVQERSSRLTLQGMELDLEEAQEELEELETIQNAGGLVSAKSSGILEALGVSEGTLTSGTETIILASPELEACGVIPAQEIGRISAGDTVDVLFSGAAKPTSLTVERLETDAEGNLVWYALYTGTNGRSSQPFSYEFEQTSDTIYEQLIPLTALYESSGNTFVLTVEMRTGILGDSYTAVPISVTVLEKDANHAAIQSSLPRDAQIITSSNKYVKGGDRIRLDD